MPVFPVQILRADGTAAADALVSVATAPGPVVDLGLVADAAGLVAIDGPAGPYTLSVWLDGAERRVPCRLDTPGRARVLRLPV
jgi:hypothetical protein